MTRTSKGEPYCFLAPFAREQRGQTTERVERALRAAIVGLDFAPGEFIDKGAVCGRLGVSRFPVSEALGRLAAEGLVEVLPQRGTRAARIRLNEVREAMMIRRALEAMVAETAALRLPSEAVAELKDNLEAQAAAAAEGDRSRFHALDLAFHEILVTRLDLPRVAAVIEASRANIDRVRRLLASPRRHALTLKEHRALFAAIKARDPVRARLAMEAHLDEVGNELDRFAREVPDAFVSS
jgi:DNA-binding GntR family transcriptional regulator